MRYLIMRKRKCFRVIALLLAIILTMCGCGTRQGELLAEAASKPYELDTILILDEKVPLGDEISSSVCGEIFILMNEYRQQSNLKPLKWSPDLEDCASIRAEEASVCWSHTRPNGKAWYTVNPSVMYGENLAKGYTTAEGVIQGWKDSPTHNENLLWSDFQYVAIVEYNGYYACEFA